MPAPDRDLPKTRLVLDEPLDHKSGCLKNATLVYSGGQICCAPTVGCGAVAKAHAELEPADG